MSEDYERIEGTGQIPSTGFGPGLTHLNESGTASRNENNALVESLKADKEAEQKNNNSSMLENNQNPVTEVSEQGAVQATVESVNNGMIPQGSATPDSNSSINAVVPNGTASSGTLLSGTVLQNSYLKMWDGKPLSEGKLYHRNE